MPDLSFNVDSVHVAGSSTGPTLEFCLRTENLEKNEIIHSISLNTQVHIQPERRRYSPGEQAVLQDLFGEPQRWAATLRPIFWANVSTTILGFQASILADLRVPYSLQNNDAVTRYCQALQEGDIPVQLLFAGTVFYYTQAKGVQVAFIPWSKETSCRIPVTTWQELPSLCPATSRMDLDSNREPQATSSWQEIVERALAAGKRQL